MTPARYYLTLRQQPGKPAGWWPVRGMHVNLRDWPKLKFISYRDGEVVFIFEERTGVVVAFGASLTMAREMLNGQLARLGLKLIDECRAMHDLVQPGQRPKFKIK